MLVQQGFDLRVLRYQNVYGPGQEISNPYTGVLNWFSKRLLAGEPLEVYEKGFIRRDFIFVEDAVRLLRALLRYERREPGDEIVLNGGAGEDVELLRIAQKLKEIYGSNSAVTVCDKFRVGDVLGAWADMSRAEELLGFKCMTTLDDGLNRYCSWFRAQVPEAIR
jgi:dTDP-L-rhamnose 4-epimerase